MASNKVLMENGNHLNNVEIPKKVKEKIINIIVEHLTSSFYSYGLTEELAKPIAENLFEDFLPLPLNNRESNKDEILGLLEIAKEDLISSEILYNNKKYRQAILLLQQSVEKATKAICLYHNLINKEDLHGKRKREPEGWFSRHFKFFRQKKVSLDEETVEHKSPKAFILLLKRKRLSGTLYKQLYKNKGNDVKSEIENIENIINKENKLIKINKSDISQFLKASQDYLTDIKLNFSKIDKREIKSKTEVCGEAIFKDLRKIFKNNAFDQFEDKFKKVNITEIMDSSSTSMINLLPLWPLGIITYPHAVKARYNHHIKYEDLGIV